MCLTMLNDDLGFVWAGFLLGSWLGCRLDARRVLWAECMNIDEDSSFRRLADACVPRVSS